MRKIQFQTDYYYHVYNRGVDKRYIFGDEKDYFRFLLSLREFNDINPTGGLSKPPLRGRKDLLEVKSLVKFICYALLPNHYHFILKQISENGIPKFMGKISNGYTQYFNQKNNRTGSLFQGTYKVVEIKSSGYLQKLSCYINGNPEIHGIAKAKNWAWSSCQDYLGLRKGTLCNKNEVLIEFENIGEYKELLCKIIKNSREQKAEIKIMQLEEL